MLSFYRACAAVVGAMLLSGCVSATEGQINTARVAMQGSAAYRQHAMAKCLMQIRAKSLAHRQELAALLSTNVEAMPELYCKRFIGALASGRMTYPVYKAAHLATADRGEFIKIIQGR